MTEHATDEGKTLVNLDQFEKQVAELKRTYAKVPDVKTKAGYQEAKEGIRALTKMRTDTEKARLAITAPLRDRVKEINDLAKSLVGEVEKLEKPIRDAKQEVDDEIKRKNEARQAKIREGITRDITSYIDTAQASIDPGEVRTMIEILRDLDVCIYGELEKEADDERQRVIGQLSTIALDLINHDLLTQEKAPEPEVRPSSSGHVRAAKRSSAEPYDEALEDIKGIVEKLITADDIVTSTFAEEVLIAVMAGDIRHITFDS